MLIAAALLTAYWALLYALQRLVLFPAPPVSRAGPDPGSGIEPIWLDAEGARSEAWFLPAAGSAAAPVILFAHGNAELIDDWPAEFEPVRAWGVSVLLVEYPGYGRSPGKPSQRAITRAFAAAHDWASRQARIDSQRIIGYGRSVGGGAVCALAGERALAALVLESSFASVRQHARSFGMPGFLVRDPFDNLACVRAFRGPILLLHGERDRLIPVRNARMLHAAAPGSELHLLPCGHNDCPRPWKLLGEFLARNGLLSPP
jgi:fermentation-respiration switch protein FrsA (DUF1100 family)